MKRYNWILILVLITGCQLVVDFDIPVDKPKLVLNAIVNPDSTWKVSVSQSRHILDRFPSADVPNANVILMDENENLLGYLQQEKPGEYGSDSKPQVNTKYKLKVEVPGYETLLAQTTIPQPIPVTAIKIDTVLKDWYSEVTAELTFTDPPEKNYYQVYWAAEVSVQSGTSTGEKTDTITYLFPLYLPQTEFEESSAVFNDTKFNNTTTKIKVQLNHLAFGTIIKHRIILFNLNEDYYNYELTRRLQERTSGDPFAQPVQVFTNITNGIGIFTACAGYSFELE